MPKLQVVSRTSSTTQIFRNNIQISRRTNSRNGDIDCVAIDNEEEFPISAKTPKTTSTWMI